MEILALLLLPPLIGLALIIVVAIWGANMLSYRLIGRKHQWLEEILATGDAPLSWRKELAAKLSRQSQHATSTSASILPRTSIRSLTTPSPLSASSACPCLAFY